MIAFLAVVSMAVGLNAHAQSTTGPWQWTDLSDKLSVRDNRPVWAVVRAEPYWYMTDGQELWSGGHVWKTDGSVMTDITVDVRNAGISRVDDMVSDGQAVLFLKNVTRRDNQFEVVSYNGSYSNRTSLLRGYFNSNEGITSISGKSGMWMIVTGQNRVFSWNTGSNTLSQISLPVTPSNSSNQPYSIRHSSPADGYSTFTAPQAVPTSGGWIFTIPQNSTPNVRTYFYQNGYFNEISLGLSNLQFIASNGNQVILRGNNTYGSYTNNSGFLVLDGSTVKNQNYVYSDSAVYASIDWSSAIASYNGKSWMITGGKKLVRFDGTRFDYYGSTNDLFLSVAGNGSGTFLLGGAVSTANNSYPTSPLTAKLVRVDEGTGYAAPTTDTSGNTVYSDEKLTTTAGKKNNITYRAFFTPDWALQDNVSDPKYTVVGQSYDGLRRIELYINGVRQRVCDGKDSKSNVTCAMFIESTGYVYDEDVAVNAKLTSAKGLVTWVPVRDIQFHNGTVNHSASATGNDGPVTANMSVSNGNHTLTRGTYVSVTANASAPAGLSRMDLYVNGSVKGTCSVSGTYNTCNFNLNTDYPNGSTIAFNVRAVDVNGRDGWTWLGTYEINDQYVNNTNSGDMTSNLSVDSWTGSGSGASAYVKALGYSPNGLNRLDLYANGSLYRSCTYSQAYGTQTCAVSIWASSFPYTSTVPTYVVATDSNGRQATSNTINLNFNNNTSNGGTSTVNGNVWFDAQVSNNQELRRDLTQAVTVYGQTASGLNKLEIYANDNLIQQCTFNNVYTTQSCQTTIYGSSYNEGSSVYLKARSTDANGSVVWTSGTLYLRITGNGSGNGGATVYTTVSPSDNNWNRNTTRYITAYGSDGDGLRRLEIFMRGVSYKSCEFGDVSGTQSCSVTVNGTDNTAGSNVEISARATDRYGNVTWSSSQYFLMTNDGGNQNGSVSLSVNPDKTSYARNESAALNANASDNDGIKRIDVYANGSIVNTCTASYSNTNYTCSANVYFNNYTAGNTSISVQAKVTDIYENTAWSSAKYLTVSDYQNPGAMVFSVSPDKTSYTANENATVSMSWPVTDITRMEIYANSNLVQTCNNPSGYAPSCSTILNTSGYANSNVTLQGKFISSQGNVNWTNTRSISVTASQQQTTDQPGTVSVSTNVSGGYTSGQYVTFTATGSDPNGIQRIEVLVDAKLAKTCEGTSTCSFTGGPYSSESLSYGANLYDSLGNRTWTGYSTINKK